jgi:hypothetical protein
VPGEIAGFEGERVAILLVGLLGVGLLLVPFVDRAGRPRFVSQACTVFGVALLAFMLTMTALAYLKPY